MVEQLIEIPLPGRAFASPALEERAARPSARLPSFVTGPENRVVAAAVGRLIAEVDVAPQVDEPNIAAPSLVALHGTSGVGKTHLARGLVEYWQSRRGADSAEYVAAADFRRAFLDAIGDDSVANARRRFRQRELLAIDDLHQLPGDQFLMEELRYTLDECHDAGQIVLVTSPRTVGALANLPDDVRSRLAGGLVLQLAPPTAESRLQIVRQAAHALSRPLSEDALRRLADGVTGTANELFAALFELFCSQPTEAASDAEQVDNLLAARAERRPPISEIIAVVARYYRLPQKLVRSSSRKQAIVVARSTIVYLARELAGISYEQIGRALGGRDHTTIMHNFHTIDRQRQRDWQTQEILDKLRRILSSR